MAGERGRHDPARQPPGSVHPGTAHGTAYGTHARCARPHRRTAHTAHPPTRGCAAGCAVGGANLAPPAHRSPPAGGGGGPPAAASYATAVATAPPSPSAHAPSPVSRYPTRTPAAVPGMSTPRPPPCGPQRAIHGPGRRSSGRMPVYAGPYAGHPRTPLAAGGPVPAGRPPRGASRPQRPRLTGPPRGVERPRRAVRFARLIHTARPRSWRTYGPRRLRRRSEPGLVATHGDTGWTRR
jgi:hypothetical protein